MNLEQIKEQYKVEDSIYGIAKNDVYDLLPELRKSVVSSLVSIYNLNQIAAEAIEQFVWNEKMICSNGNFLLGNYFNTLLNVENIIILCQCKL